MLPPNLRIWRYRLVWHSRTLWRSKLRRGLTSVTQETTKQIAFVKSGANSLLIFTKTNFLFVSCVAEPNPCTVFSPIRSLNGIPSDISKYANLVGALLARTFFLLGIDMWKSQFQHSGWRSPFAACCKIYVVYVRLSFTTCINKCYFTRTFLITLINHKLFPTEQHLWILSCSMSPLHLVLNLGLKSLLCERVLRCLLRQFTPRYTESHK